MHHRYNLIPFLLLLLYGPLVALPGAGDHPVQARLLATVDVVVPGQVFKIGVELKMEEGWHTYWSFSGDAGLPIEIAWQSPDGYTTGPLQWPLPSKYEEEGGLTVYGYADEVLLAAPDYWNGILTRSATRSLDRCGSISPLPYWAV